METSHTLTLTALFALLIGACTNAAPGPGGEEAESEGEAEAESEAESEGEGEAEAEGEGESESESEGDQPCPEEGCETEMPCADDGNCPGDDPCRDYFCDGRDGFCRYWLTDVDGDGYVRESCGGEDCDDRSSEECKSTESWDYCGDRVHPGAVEDCTNGTDDDCDGDVDEDVREVSCGPTTEIGICRLGTRSCLDGAWTECEGAVYPEEQEICDGEDNDCDGLVDNGYNPPLVMPCDPFQQTGCDPRNTGTSCYVSFEDGVTWCQCAPPENPDECWPGSKRPDRICASGYQCYDGVCYLPCLINALDADCPVETECTRHDWWVIYAELGLCLP